MDVIRVLPERAEPVTPRRPPVLGALLVVLALLGGFALLRATSPSPEVVADTSGDAELAIPDSPRIDPYRLPGSWVLVGSVDVSPWRPFRIAGGHLLVGSAELFVVEPEGVVRPVRAPGVWEITGSARVGAGAIVFGTSYGLPGVERSLLGPITPTLWIDEGGDSLRTELLPWTGSVRAVAENADGMVAIGTRADTDVIETVIATRRRTTWTVEPGPQVPRSQIRSVAGGFVALGREEVSERRIFLFSSDGHRWEPVGEHIIGAHGDVAVIESGSNPRLVMPATGFEVFPPEWPVTGVWFEGERVWLQAAEAAWTSTDGLRWERLAFDGDVGHGYPVLMPVGDQVLLGVSRSGGTDLYQWRSR